MGWTPKQKIINVDFTGTEFEGLNVKVKDVPLAQIVEMGELIDESKSGGATGGKALRKLVAMAEDMLLDWDLEVPEGNLLPPTGESLLRLDQGVSIPLMTLIVSSVQKVPAELGKDLRSGGPSLAALPMTAP